MVPAALCAGCKRVNWFACFDIACHSPVRPSRQLMHCATSTLFQRPPCVFCFGEKCRKRTDGNVACVICPLSILLYAISSFNSINTQELFCISSSCCCFSNDVYSIRFSSFNVSVNFRAGQPFVTSVTLVYCGQRLDGSR